MCTTYKENVKSYNRKINSLKLNNTDIIKLILEKALDEVNLITTTKINQKIKRFINNLIYLKIIIEKIGKINSDSRSEIKKQKT